VTATRGGGTPVEPGGCGRCGQPHPKCAGHTNGPDGTWELKPCGKWPVKGARVCRSHGAGNPQVAARAALRAEVAGWGLDAAEVDPGETMLRLLAQSSARVARYSRLLESAYSGDPDFPAEFAGSGVAALIGHRYAASMDGRRVEVGEAPRGLAELESQERDRCMHFAKLCRDAKLDERRVRLAERQVDTLELVLRAALERAGISDADRIRVIDAVPVVLGELVGSVE
jgi:hypothetical protein